MDNPKTLMDAQKTNVNMLDVNQYTPTEMMNAWISAMVLLAGSGQISGQQASYMVEVFRELLHWTFMPKGEHSSPADLLMMNTAMAGEKKPGEYDA